MSLITNEMIDSLTDRECRLLHAIVNDPMQRLTNMELSRIADISVTHFSYVLGKIYQRLEVNGVDKRSILIQKWR